MIDPWSSYIYILYFSVPYLYNTHYLHLFHIFIFCLFFFSTEFEKSLFGIFFFFFFRLLCAVCGILVSRPRSKLKTSAVEARSLNHWTAREVPPASSWFWQLCETEGQTRPGLLLEQVFCLSAWEYCPLLNCFHYQLAIFPPPSLQSLVKPPPSLPHPHVVPEPQGNLIPAVRVNKDLSLFVSMGFRTPGPINSRCQPTSCYKSRVWLKLTTNWRKKVSCLFPLDVTNEASARAAAGSHLAAMRWVSLKKRITRGQSRQHYRSQCPDKALPGALALGYLLDPIGNCIVPCIQKHLNRQVWTDPRSPTSAVRRPPAFLWLLSEPSQHTLKGPGQTKCVFWIPQMSLRYLKTLRTVQGAAA